MIKITLHQIHLNKSSFSLIIKKTSHELTRKKESFGENFKIIPNINTITYTRCQKSIFKNNIIYIINIMSNLQQIKKQNFFFT